jgi:hypothetical protein
MIEQIILDKYFTKSNFFTGTRRCKIIFVFGLNYIKKYKFNSKKGLLNFCKKRIEFVFFGNCFGKWHPCKWDSFRWDLRSYLKEHQIDENVEIENIDSLDWSFLKDNKIEALRKIIKQLRDEGIEI